jgi:hypothetical protein
MCPCRWSVLSVLPVVMEFVIGCERVLYSNHAQSCYDFRTLRLSSKKALRHSLSLSLCRLPFTYPPFYSTLHSTRPNAHPRIPLYSLYVSALSLSWSIFNRLSSAPAGSANEICAARARRGCASLLANVRRSVAVRPGGETEREVPGVVEAEEARDQRSVRRAGTYVHSPPPVAPVLVAPEPR